MINLSFSMPKWDGCNTSIVWIPGIDWSFFFYVEMDGVWQFEPVWQLNAYPIYEKEMPLSGYSCMWRNSTFLTVFD